MDARLLIQHMLGYVNSLGWCEEALWKGAQDAGLDPDQVLLRVNPTAPYMIGLFKNYLVGKIQTDPFETDLKSLRIKERMTTLIMHHLHQGAPYKPAILKTMAFFANPLNAPLSFSFAHEIIDSLWRRAGDTATDFNYYTKRFLLGKIYLATLVYWLKDTSDNFSKTQYFLEKQLDFVLKVPRKIKQLLGRA